MCLYMSVPQWLSLQNFLKAINESINHTIDVTVMFIYLKCLNNHHNNNNGNSSNNIINKHHLALTTALGTALTIPMNVEENHKIDFNANLTTINIENNTQHKTNLTDNNLIKSQQNYQNMQQQQHYQQQHYQYQQHYHQYEESQLLDKFKTLPPHL